MKSTTGRPLRVLPALRCFQATLLVLLGGGLHADFYFGDFQIHRESRSAPVLDAKTVYGGGQWMSVGRGGNLLVSPDATNWRLRPLPELVSTLDLAYGEGRWVAVSGLGIRVSNDQGQSWVAAKLPTEIGWVNLDACAFLHGYYVAWSSGSFGGGSGHILYSEDAETWSKVPAPPPSMAFSEVWYDAVISRFCVLTAEATVYTAEGWGEAWEVDYSPPWPAISDPLTAASSPLRTAFLVTADSTNAGQFGWWGTYQGSQSFLVTRTSEGSWKKVPGLAGLDPVMHRVKIADDGIYLMDRNGVLAASEDGVSWSKRDTPGWGGTFSSSFANGWWFNRSDAAFGQSGGLTRSADLIAVETVWALEAPLRLDRQPLVTDGTNGVVAFGVDAVRLDLVTQETVAIALPDGAERLITAAVWDGYRYVASGVGRSVYLSPDGIDWSTLVEPQLDTSAFRSMASAGGVYVATSEAAVWSSNDLVTWTQRLTYTDQSPSSPVVSRVVRDGDRFWLCLSAPQPISDVPDSPTVKTALFSSLDGERWVPMLPSDAGSTWSTPSYVLDFAGGETQGWSWDGASLVQRPYSNYYFSEIEEGSGYLVGVSSREIGAKASHTGGNWSAVRYAQVFEQQGISIADLVYGNGRFYFLEEAMEMFGSFVISDRPVVDRRGPGVVRLIPSEFHEEAASFTGMNVQVIREGGTVGTVSVQVSVTSGTATEGADFISTPAIVSWEEGESGEKWARIGWLVDDELIEGPETVGIVLSQPTGGLALDASTSTQTFLIIDSPFEDWSFRHFGLDSSRNGPTADPDGDGIPNLMEFRLGLDPTLDDAWILERWMRPILYPEIGQVGGRFVVDQRDPTWGVLGWAQSADGSLHAWTARRLVPQNASLRIALQSLQIPAPEADASFWSLEIVPYVPSRSGRTE